jgi:hypothetical protein
MSALRWAAGDRVMVCDPASPFVGMVGDVFNVAQLIPGMDEWRRAKPVDVRLDAAKADPFGYEYTEFFALDALELAR